MPSQFRYLTAILILSLGSVVSPVIAADVAELSLDELLNTSITTASKFSQRISDSPSSATVISREEIHAHGWHTLAEALASLPGVDVTNSLDYNFLSVRGFARPGDYNSRVLLLIDGIPSNDGVYDQALIGGDFPLDMELVERIEYVPGPGSALYGGNAMLAVVNVITRAGSSNLRSVGIGIGDRGLHRTRLSANGQDATGRHWLLSASRETYRGENRLFPEWIGIGGSDGRANGMDDEGRRQLFLRYGDQQWSIHLLHGRRTKEVAGSIYATDFDVPADFVDETTQLGFKLKHELSPVWSFDGQVFLGQYSFTSKLSYAGSWESDDAGTRWTGLNGQVTGRPWAGHVIVFGASWRGDSRWQENIGGRIESNRRITSFFGQDEVRLADWLTANLGLRHDQDNQGHSQLSPRLGLITKLPADSVLKLLAGSAFRPPNAYESEYAYPGLQIPSDNLKPERVRTLEIAFEQPIGERGRWKVAAFSNRFDDMIGLVDDGSGIFQFQNVGRASTRGIELGARYRFINGAEMRGSLTRQSSEDAEGTALTNTPRTLAKLLVRIPVGTHELAWETRFTGERPDSLGNLVGGQAVSHVAISAHLLRNLKWRVRVSNLFDRRLNYVVGDDYSQGVAGAVPLITGERRRIQADLVWNY